MAKYCESCRKKLGFLDQISGMSKCGDCLAKQYKEKKRLENEERRLQLIAIQQKKEAELAEKSRAIEEKKRIVNDIINSQTISDEDISILKSLDKSEKIDIFCPVENL